ncbi:MAG: B12-binding domain-containing radical SAM protein [Desulfobacterales bacterium]|nr:MAG: B12-binding domain-containing radical SAM protein [Desulfobacterales bacterium]
MKPLSVLLVRARPSDIQNTRLPKSLNRELGHVPPLGIASIASLLKKHHHTVSIIDAQAEDLDMSQVKQRIDRCDPDVVGVTSMTPTVHDDLNVIRLAKKYGAVTVLGGPQASIMPVETMHHKDVDFVIQGEGEIPMLKLLQALIGRLEFKDVPGLVYRNENSQIKSSRPYIHPTLDDLPEPARELLPNDRYSSIITQGRLTTVCPGKGCPFKCGFCFKQPSDRVVRFRKPALVVDEIENAVNTFGIKEINFVSDTFTFNRSFITNVCEIILQRNINVSWVAPSRADCVDLNLLKLMKRAGCRSLRFGVESGSTKILKLMDKNIDKQQIIHAFRLAKAAKIETFAYIIIGYLHETEKTIQETFHFLAELKPDIVAFNSATPLPGTVLFEQAVSEGIVPSNYWKRFVTDGYNERIPYLFPDTELWISKAYRKFFFSPRIIKKHILKVRPGSARKYFKALRGLIRL